MPGVGGDAAGSRPAAGGEPPRILLAGAPGSGRTAIVRAVLERLPGVRASGFTTDPRTDPPGFRATSLAGASGGLATVGAVGPDRVGAYAVHRGTFEAVAVPALAWREDVELWVVDGIGPLECASKPFTDAARRVLGGSAPVLGTVARRGRGLIASARELSGVEVIEVEGRDPAALVEELVARLAAALPARAG